MNKLAKLAIKHGSDKHGHHDYARHYEKHFAHLENEPIVLLELGVGGYEFPERGGAGLRMWSDYFTKGKIYGIDWYDKSRVILPPRTKIFQGSQNDGDFLTRVLQESGNPDIIIDDASHVNTITIESFLHLFPWLKSGGLYVIEDIESSWWEDHGFDGCADYTNMMAKTTVNFARILINNVNAKHSGAPKEENYGIESMHFYENLIIIVKK